MPKLYTKKGDYGITSLYDGSKKEKKSVIFDTLGDIDELASHIGLLITKIEDLHFRDIMRIIQVKLLDIGSNIAVIDEKKRGRVPQIEENDVVAIENWIDECEEKTSKLTEFLLCGVSDVDAQCHICRSVSRRTERSLWKVNGLIENDVYISVDENIMKYVNRLSDFFFAYSRVLSSGREIKVSDIKKKLATI